MSRGKRAKEPTLHLITMAKSLEEQNTVLFSFVSVVRIALGLGMIDEKVAADIRYAMDQCTEAFWPEEPS